MPKTNITPSIPGLAEEENWLLDLLFALQRSLDVGELLMTFSRQVSSVIPHEQVKFTSPSGTEHFCGTEVGNHTHAFSLALSDEEIGTLCFARTHPFQEKEVPVLEQAAQSLAYPIRNAMVYEQVVTASRQDGLTQLGNRAAMESTLARAFASARRYGEGLSLILLDVDHFKRVNDRHGHLVGDEVLKALADYIRGAMRETDIAFRYGGEEFIIVLEKTELHGARLLAERIVSHLAMEEIKTKAGPIRVTMSLGIAVLLPNDTRESLIGRADRALYTSKTTGRNRITADTTSGLHSGACPPQSMSLPKT